MCAASQVRANKARPPSGHAEAPLRVTVIEKVSLRAIGASFPHEMWVLQQASSRRGPARPLQPCSTLSPSLCAAFVRRARAGSTAVTITTASEVAAIVAVVSGPRVDDSVLLSTIRGVAGPLKAALEQLRRRFGGRGGAAAWRPSPGGLDGRSRGQRRLAGGLFAPWLRVSYVCACACTKMRGPMLRRGARRLRVSDLVFPDHPLQHLTEAFCHQESSKNHLWSP